MARCSPSRAQATSFEIPHCGMQLTVYKAGKMLLFLFFYLFIHLTFASAFDRPRPTWDWLPKRFGFNNNSETFTVNHHKQCHAGDPLKSTAMKTKTTPRLSLSPRPSLSPRLSLSPTRSPKCIHPRRFGSQTARPQTLTAVSTASKKMTTSRVKGPATIPVAVIPVRKMTTPTFNSWVTRTLQPCWHPK